MTSKKPSLKAVMDMAWKIGRERGLTDDEIVAAIEEIIRERQKEEQTHPKVQRVDSPQLLYGPPQVMEEHVVKIDEPRQLLYGPPPVMEEHVVKIDEPRQLLYGPPPVMEEHVVVMPQVLYGPPPRQELDEMFVDVPAKQEEDNSKKK